MLKTRTHCKWGKLAPSHSMQGVTKLQKPWKSFLPSYLIASIFIWNISLLSLFWISECCLHILSLNKLNVSETMFAVSKNTLRQVTHIFKINQPLFLFLCLLLETKTKLDSYLSNIFQLELRYPFEHQDSECYGIRGKVYDFTCLLKLFM